MARTDPPAPIEQGAQIRLTRDVVDLTGDRRHHAGLLATVEDYVSAAESEDGQPFYWASSNLGGNDVCVPADAVELVRTAAQVAARRPPTRIQVRDAISSALMVDADTFRCYQADRDGRFSVEVYGETEEGLRFGFRVTVAEVWETDL